MKKNKEGKKKKILWVLVVFVFVVLLVIIGLLIFNKDKDKDDKTSINEIKKIDEINEYNYYLVEDATKYYKKLYDELKNVVNTSSVDMEKYASIVARCFVSDVFNLDNKLTSNDIGGVQFVYPSYVDDFIKINHSTLYSNVLSNIYGDRVQELPVVSDVIVTNIESGTYTYLEKSYDSYTVNMDIVYEKDLGYPSSYKVVLIKDDMYLYVVSGE